jgi:hypothetical protein
VPEGGHEDSRATTCRKKVIAPSYDMGYSYEDKLHDGVSGSKFLN